jgi:hypothetical protein
MFTLGNMALRDGSKPARRRCTCKSRPRRAEFFALPVLATTFLKAFADRARPHKRTADYSGKNYGNWNKDGGLLGESVSLWLWPLFK